MGLTYANHFHNGFHFDDFHSITQNAVIRHLGNVPRFFTDPTISSTLPTHRSWRPVVTASLALDYWLAHGYSPVVFQLSTFVWFLVQLASMRLLFSTILRRIAPPDDTLRAAWFAIALYGLHPAMAETVNYIVQRAEVISTCGVVAGLAIYARYPSLRRSAVYLVPVTVGLLAKPPALVFPLLLAAYEFCGEEPTSLARSIRKALPAFALAAVFILLHTWMTPNTFVSGGEAHSYWLTQPYVAFRYFTSFFLPLHLSADTDLAAFHDPWTPEVFGGFLFLIALVYAIVALSRIPAARAIAFGLAWFLLALLPTSIFPLAEVENDHRMFFPFVGLTLAVTAAGAHLLRKAHRRETRLAAAAALACFLLMLALGTHRRNEIWRSDETLWQDVTVKSPRNGRGWMNYGLTQMSQGRIERALALFEHAQMYAPDYSLLQINLGIAHGALHRDAPANAHFLRAIDLDPQSADSYFYYARWLAESGHAGPAASLLKRALALNPNRQDARDLLLSLQRTASGRN